MHLFSLLNSIHLLNVSLSNFCNAIGDLVPINMIFRDKTSGSVMKKLLYSNIDTLEYVGIKCDYDKAEDKGLKAVVGILIECLQNEHKSRLKIRIKKRGKIVKGLPIPRKVVIYYFTENKHYIPSELDIKIGIVCISLDDIGTVWI